MTRIQVDDLLQAKLRAQEGLVELCDAEGRVIGTFIPHPGESLEWLRPQVSDEELRRRAQSTDWFTTQEVLDHLRDNDV